MNDEQFEGRMQIVEVEVSQLMANQLRARDTAQREALAQIKTERDQYDELHLESIALAARHEQALARVEAERDEAIKLLGWSKYQLMLWEDYQVENGFEVEDHYVTGKVREGVEAFLARHVQAEQQEAKPVAVEAQGAQAGNETQEQKLRALVSNYEKGDRLLDFELETVTKAADEIARLRAALATQPEVPEQYEYWCIAFGRWKPIQELVEFLTSRGFKVRAVRGDEQ